MGAVVAAAGMMKKQKDLIAHFEREGATSAATAQTLAALGIDEGLAFRRLRSRAVIREDAHGTFYLDEPAWRALGQSRRRTATVVVLIGLAIVVVIALTTRSHGSP